MDQQDVIKKLMEAAVQAREKAYVPYSEFSVGAALLTEDGEIFTGCNVENMAYPAGLCAERVALFSAVAAGHRRFAALAVSGGKRDCAPHDYCMPCGMCRQALREFCGPELDIYVVKSRDQVKHLTLGDLLPHAFSSLDKAKF